MPLKLKSNFGVCRMSILSVRGQPADTAEQVTQLLFGDHYEVVDVSENGKWLNIRIQVDGYVGWISANQHHSIDQEYFEHINKADFKISTDVVTTILYNKAQVPIVIGSIIPISAAELFRMEEKFAFNGESKSIGQKRGEEFLLSVARKYLNAPYQWGGKSPFGIDCSGFTQMVFRIAGYQLPRDSSQQINAGRKLSGIGECRAGDLAFFRNKEGIIHHTGILVDENSIIHASGKVRIDHLNDHGILNTETKIYTHDLDSLVRIIPVGSQS